MTTLKDTRDCTHFYFSDKIVTVTADGIETMPYTEESSSRATLPYQYNAPDTDQKHDFEQFCINLCNHDTHQLHTTKKE